MRLPHLNLNLGATVRDGFVCRKMDFADWIASVQPVSNWFHTPARRSVISARPRVTGCISQTRTEEGRGRECQ